ncbi:hypothetical protein [Lyngbya aestuarii]|uniref:hypothetical protein n=1 Tax=Lyngbya aestuarii TaxID=118322 RepID=UPI00403D9819
MVKELLKLFPISAIHYELVMADVDRTSGRKNAKSGKGFSPVMVGQRQMLKWLSELAPPTRVGVQETLRLKFRFLIVIGNAWGSSLPRKSSCCSKVRV